MFALSAKGVADAPLTRPCRSSDLNGIYVLAQYKEIGGQGFSRSASHFRYRFLELTPPGIWVEHSMNRIPANPALIEKILSNDPKDRSYSLDSAARLVVKHGDQILFTGSCAVSLGERDGFQANDLILSGGLTNNPGELHELFRRWNGEPYQGAAAGCVSEWSDGWGMARRVCRCVPGSSCGAATESAVAARVWNVGDG